MRQRAERVAAERVKPIERATASHTGPPVAAGTSGTARFAGPVCAAFDAQRALELARFADGFYREPANDGFEAVLARLETELRSAGFGASAELELEWLATEPREAWTPLSARLASIEGGAENVLLEFDSAEDVARTMLPSGAPACDVRGPACFELEQLSGGDVLVLAERANGSTLAAARDRGAVAVLSAGLESYNVDPSGAGRERDAIQYSSVSRSAPLPVARISARVLESLRAARARDGHSQIALRAEVKLDSRPLRTLVATVVGASRPDEAILVAAHVQEPGACDNASGVGGICEGARVVASAIRESTFARPARSLVFVFGQEHFETRTYLEHASRRVVAGISADMLGESRERTGALALLERGPDPGAVKPLAPDEHTAWGSRDVSRSELSPNGVAVVARCALVDVAAFASADGAVAWSTREHPYEGGSDHDELLRKGIPGVLFWHFPDFAYHTSLDRMEHVDAAELARSASSVITCALALADAQPADLERYLASLRLELELRVNTALEAKDEELATLWREWSRGARLWLRELCLPGSARPADAASRTAPNPEPK